MNELYNFIYLGSGSNKKHILILPSYAVNVSLARHLLQKSKSIVRKLERKVGVGKLVTNPKRLQEFEKELL